MNSILNVVVEHVSQFMCKDQWDITTSRNQSFFLNNVSIMAALDARYSLTAILF